MYRLVVIALVACQPNVVMTTREAKADLGDTLTIDSKILGERRVINVFVPKDHDEPLPVLYMPDGGMAEDFPHVVGSVDVSIKDLVIRPMIVVGIENTERRRDLVGPTTVPQEIKDAPHAGGADKFRRFIREELKPLIASRYHTTHESAVIGESLAGLFVLETFLVDPTLFDAYIAVDPSVWWNEQALVRDANLHMTPGAKALYVATADYRETQEGIATLLTALRINAPAGVTWTYEPMPEEHHNTIYAIAAVRGLRALFALPN